MILALRMVLLGEVYFALGMILWDVYIKELRSNTRSSGACAVWRERQSFHWSNRLGQSVSQFHAPTPPSCNCNATHSLRRRTDRTSDGGALAAPPLRADRAPLPGSSRAMESHGRGRSLSAPILGLQYHCRPGRQGGVVHPRPCFPGVRTAKSSHLKVFRFQHATSDCGPIGCIFHSLSWYPWMQF